MKAMKLPTTEDFERLPWGIRALMGCEAALLAQVVNFWFLPLRAVPMALAFPAVILCAWFLEMWGAAVCALTSIFVVDFYLTQTHLEFPSGNGIESIRLAIFLMLALLMGWMMRRLAQSRTLLRTQELQQRLKLSEAEHAMAEERARISEQLRERNEVLNIALEVNSMGLWVWDLLEDAAYGSDPVCEVAGRVPGSTNQLPKDWLRLIHPDDVEGVKAALAETRDNHQDYHQQFRVMFPDGSVRWMESQGKCQRNSEGRVTRVVGVLADVTLRKLTEETMLRTEKLAVAGRLAASVANEINNPLEAMGNMLYLISIAETADAARPYARQALDELMRVSLITQQTLKFHRQPGMPTVILLSEVVTAVLALFHGKLHSSGIKTEMRKARKGRETGVACMPSEMHQIFANLVANAIDAMPEGGRLAVRLRPSHDWRDRSTAGMRVTFCDSGTGMNRATMHHCFEPFFTTKTETGTGLGLWVVAQLLERRKGHVRVWSSQLPEASGTAFSIFLPFEEKSVNGAAFKRTRKTPKAPLKPRAPREKPVTP
jgi:PAS domain S-box-containing protein